MPHKPNPHQEDVYVFPKGILIVSLVILSLILLLSIGVYVLQGA